MKKKFMLLVSISSILAFNPAYAANPVTKEWVLQQIASQHALTAADWNAVCTTGTSTSTTGCYGNASSTAFTNLSNHLGGLTTYANINPVNAPSSVYLKTFFGGTNIPTLPTYISINVVNSAARCGLFTQSGLGLGVPGVNTSNPTSGNTGAGAPNSASVASINNTVSTTEVPYNSQDGGSLAATLAGPNPIYLVCVGYNPANGSTASSVTINAS